jgi:hypothetical protein
MNPAKLKLLGAFAAMFLLGAVTGGALMHVIEAQRAIDMFDSASKGSRNGVFLWSLDRKLGLSAEQRQAFEAIMAQYDRDLAAVIEPLDPRVKALREKMRADIRARLSPAQQPRFDELMASWDATSRRPKREGGEAGGSGQSKP